MKNHGNANVVESAEELHCEVQAARGYLLEAFDELERRAWVLRTRARQLQSVQRKAAPELPEAA